MTTTTDTTQLPDIEVLRRDLAQAMLDLANLIKEEAENAERWFVHSEPTPLETRIRLSADIARQKAVIKQIEADLQAANAEERMSKQARELRFLGTLKRTLQMTPEGKVILADAAAAHMKHYEEDPL